MIGHRDGSLGRNDSPKEGGVVVHSKGIMYRGDEQSYVRARITPQANLQGFATYSLTLLKLNAGM